jgi:tRNA-Thr(GGU) m(6)t(6)A37 methyltransferase TsaA
VSIIVEPVGFVMSTRGEVADDDWDREKVSVVLTDEFEPDALFGLTDFSHVEILYHFARVDPQQIERGARHPRGNLAWPRVGVFAQRVKNRPNRIGATICRVLDVDGRTLRVSGLDAVDGTPVLDIKPYMAEFGPRGDIYQPIWAGELMRQYWVAD